MKRLKVASQSNCLAQKKPKRRSECATGMVKRIDGKKHKFDGSNEASQRGRRPTGTAKKNKREL